ncbi:MAG: hypothetical protein H0X30_20785 [Anaerolineae bacterium]|nr:hypothetical protein [Anaerolineae bacterium]
MNSNRLPLVGLVIMIIIAVFALALQQQAVNDLRTQMTRAANADNDKTTAVAMMNAASGTQVKTGYDQATAQAAAQVANTAQATAQAAAGTSAAQLDDAGTRSAQFAATGTANFDAMQATSTMHANDLATLQAESTAEVATLQGQLAAESTAEAGLLAQLGTATAQVDLAEFARKAAEDDRTNALNQLWTVGTRQADSSSQLATAQFMLTGAPPATAALKATATPELQLTSVNDTAATTAPTTANADGTLGQTFQSTDKKAQVGYPAGWFAQETQSGTIIIVNQQSMLTRTTYGLTKGQIEVDVLVGTYSQFNLTAGTAPQQLLTTIVTNVKAQQTKFNVGDVTSITVGSHKAAQVKGNDGDNDLSITVIQLSNNDLAVVYGLAATGEFDASFDTVMTIASSVSYTE